jgi:predicted ATP-dependent protease
LLQSLAVTGSINQLGEIQAVGGVNEKIEGFFELCDARGLNGKQGVIIPAANKAHLMLYKDVRESVKKGAFNIYPVERVEDVMQLLSGLPPGNINSRGNYPRKSFNYLIQQRIAKLQKLQRQYAHPAGGKKS